MGVSEPDRTPIVLLTAADASDVLPLSIAAGWNQVAADWRLLLGAGRGFGIRQNGAFIASGLALPLGQSIWWISMLLVAEGFRRHGHGTRLLARCMAEIATVGAAMGLDATEFGRPIYLPLGFRDAYPITRWSSARRPVLARPPRVDIGPAGVDDLPGIGAYDAPRSGLQRETVLAGLRARAPALAHLARHSDGRLAGYVLGRDGQRAAHIGPVVADEPAIAMALIAQAAGGTGGQVIIDVPDHHASVGAWLAAEGAAATRRYMRMLRGAAPVVQLASHVLAITGPEFA
jgi:GNAT superfamily N-acetyltransferase